MENKKLTFATIVATPTASSWSQAYTAGNLFAAFSLRQNSVVSEDKNEESLAAIGKDVINTLEAEYFTIEAKNLDSIKQAVEIAVKSVLEKETITLSASFASIIDNVLYLVVIGGAKVYIKRDDSLGLLLQSEEIQKTSSASGFLRDLDTVIIQTAQFNSIVPKEKLKTAIDHNTPSEIAERLSPFVHEQEEGGAAALVISYKEPIIEVLDEKEEKKFFDKLPKSTDLIFQVLIVRLSNKRKIFFAAAVLLTLLLIGSILFVSKRKEDAKNEILFQEVFTAAQKKYEEGQSLISLNKNLARDDFWEAKKILAENKNKFKKNSKHEKELLELSKKVETSLVAASSVNIIPAKPVGKESSILLATSIDNTPISITQDEKNVYGITSDVVFTVDKKSKNKKTIIPNKDYWDDVGGLGVYFGNIYVLDKRAGQIFKFTGSEFNKSNYLVGGMQDFSNVQSITIDGSVFVLFNDGVIKKFIRGRQEDFGTKELDKPLKNPSLIFTDAETNNLYILDKGNSRIVVLNKSGVYQTQYQADVLKDAKEFDVKEKDKKIFVLSGGKLWQIDLTSQ
ncbi:MAG: hypothetical protein HYV39_01960 [Candidatus Levybacteria bacterium]|nr:hypothetical protein [Candidatus Levybacteria bacterium]